MPSTQAKQLQRFQGLIWGDGVKDSALYFDGHTLVVDVVGRTAGVRAISVRGLATNNAPTEVFGIDKDGAVAFPAGIQTPDITSSALTGNLWVTTVTAINIGSGGTTVTIPGNLVVSGSVNGQTISAAASFTGTVAVATGVTTPGYIRALGPVYAGVTSYTSQYDNPFSYSRAITVAVDAAGAAQDAGLVLVGRRTADARFAALSFYNSPSGTTVNHMGQIHADRAGADNTGSIVIATAAAGVLTDRVTILAGVQVGSPTGGDKGAGTINVAVDVYKNNSAYANPDYVFEHWATGQIERYADNDRAAGYAGLPPLDALRAHVLEHWRFPQIGDTPLGAFARADVVLELVEQAHLYLFQLADRIATLELERGAA